MQNKPRQLLFLYIFSAAAVLYAFYLFNPFLYYFLNDDLIHIPLSKNGVLFQRRSFRPIGDLSVTMDYLLWGKKAWGYHLTNLLLHALNSVLLFFVAKQFFQKSAPLKNVSKESLMVALLFFVYACHSESVFWILGRSGSLGCLFFLAALWCYNNRFLHYAYYASCLAFFVLGLLAYESVWIFPLVAATCSIVDHKEIRTTARRATLYVVGLAVVFAAVLFLRAMVIGQVIADYEGAALLSGSWLALTVNFCKLTTRLFVPSFTQSSFLVIGVVLVIAALLIGFYKAYRSRKYAIDGLLFLAFLMLVSVLPYVSLGIDTHGVEGERYLYLPSVFACLLIVSTIYKAIQGRWTQIIAFLVIIAIHLVFLTRSANYYKVASGISRTTFQQIKKLPKTRTLYVDSLPQSYNGALIFRLGFEEGVSWLADEASLSNVVVLSLKQDNRRWSTPYTAGLAQEGFVTTMDSVLVRDPSQRQTYISQVKETVFNPSTDVKFVFTNKQLEIQH